MEPNKIKFIADNFDYLDKMFKNLAWHYNGGESLTFHDTQVVSNGRVKELTYKVGPDDLEEIRVMKDTKLFKAIYLGEK